MNKQNIQELERDIEQREKRRDQKKRKRMKISGAGVKNLQKIFAKKS